MEDEQGVKGLIILEIQKSGLKLVEKISGD